VQRHSLWLAQVKSTKPGRLQGTAIIRYTWPSGVPFSEWIMYVQPPTG
jgi:hypothetical protein